LWYSPVGGLYLSLLLFPHERFNSIALLASLTVIKTLEDLSFSKLSILWPNDVLLNNRKVCGVLCEQYKKAIICGIGLNANIKKFSPKIDNATSLLLESGQNYKIEELFESILKKFESLYAGHQKGMLKIKEIRNYITGIGEPVEILTQRGNVNGTVFDIDDDWALLLRDESGIIRKFYYGDVKKLRW